MARPSYSRTRQVTAAAIAREMGWTSHQLRSSQNRQVLLWQRARHTRIGTRTTYDADLIEALRAVRQEDHREITDGPDWLDRYLQEEHDALSSPRPGRRPQPDGRPRPS